MDFQHASSFGLVPFADAQGPQDITAFENLTGLQKPLIELSVLGGAFIVKEQVEWQVFGVDPALIGPQNHHPFDQVFQFADIAFACTSEDINNLSYALMLLEARMQVVLPLLDLIIDTLDRLALELAETPMLSRTHGQPASPTTWARRLPMSSGDCAVNVVDRSGAHPRQDQRRGRQLQCPSDGYPESGLAGSDARASSRRDSLDWNPYTTQIEPHDYMAELFDALARAQRHPHRFRPRRLGLHLHRLLPSAPVAG